MVIKDETLILLGLKSPLDGASICINTDQDFPWLLEASGYEATGTEVMRSGHLLGLSAGGIAIIILENKRDDTISYKRPKKEFLQPPPQCAVLL